MNCERIRENLVNSLAAGESAPSGGLALHIRSCDSCRSFYENQANLLRSVDAGVRAMVNQEVPPSLLPGFRARLSEQSTVRRAWIPAWSLAAAVAAVVILFFGVNHLQRKPGAQSNLAANSTITPARVNNPRAPEQLIPEANITQRHVGRKQANPEISVPASVEPSSEVIVLAEEREAFARFVAEIPQKRDVALALTKQAPVQPDAPIEIALLRIDGVNLNSVSPAVEPIN